jgi:transcriptional antiterminator RfaH|tara:strand:- start:189 stop:665 length:477 start_codon:yes stop_codon:yes gene_type:complete
MKVWMVATYKINQFIRVQQNLKNQSYEFYNPKVRIKKQNSSFNEELLFPGYIFIHSSLDQYQKIKYTKGIKEVIRFDSNVAILSNDEINELRRVEKNSYTKPIAQNLSIGQETTISKGPFKGSIITIASLPKKHRISVFVHILGKKRRITASLDDINA